MEGIMGDENGFGQILREFNDREFLVLWRTVRLEIQRTIRTSTSLADTRDALSRLATIGADAARRYRSTPKTDLYEALNEMKDDLLYETDNDGNNRR